MSLPLLAVQPMTSAQSQTGNPLEPADRAEIQALVSGYAAALGNCEAEAFAELFVPETGYFASGFRGRMVGREQLIELVTSERHCRTADGSAPNARPGGAAGPTVDLEVGPDGVFGIADLGTAEYQDEYTKTAGGWRFASRTVVLPTEKEAGLNAPDFLAIQKLGGPSLGTHYEADAMGMRLLNAGVVVTVMDGEVTGRAYLKDGSYRDEVYRKDAQGNWQISSSRLVAPESP